MRTRLPALCTETLAKRIVLETLGSLLVTLLGKGHVCICVCVHVAIPLIKSDSLQSQPLIAGSMSGL